MNLILSMLFFALILPYGKSRTVLQLVHVLFRHGERTPTESYANDPYGNYTWPEGWGQLSNKGKMQLYDLGKRLKERYKDFLSLKYYPENVLMESSYADRCHMSAQLLLAGLYPPVNEQIWNKNLHWLPIPVHSLPRKLDNKIAMKAKCPVYEQELEMAYKSDRIVKINEKNRDLFDYLTENTGQKIDNITALEFLYNTLEIEKMRGFALPKWTETVFEIMKPLAAESLAIFTDTPLMRRLKGGVLLKEIIEHMRLKTLGKLNKEIFLYSAHDISIVNVLRTLNFTKLIKPGYAAFVAFELHKKEFDYFVKLFYQDSPEDEIIQLKLSFCDSLCSLDEFISGLQSMIPIDWNEECNRRN